MSAPILFHLVVGVSMLLLGVAFLKRRRAVPGWILCVSGFAFATAGLVVPALHRQFFH
jgi:hypothetical protein